MRNNTNIHFIFFTKFFLSTMYYFPVG